MNRIIFHLFLHIGSAEWKDDGKNTALSQLALHGNLPVHLGEDIFYDRHSKPCSGYILRAESYLPLIGDKDPVQKIPGHAGTRILKDQLIFHKITVLPFRYFQRNGIPLRGEFHRVGQKIAEDLRHAEGIPVYFLRLNVKIKGKCFPLSFYLIPHHIRAVGDTLLQIKMFGIQGDLSFFQFGYLQDIIDQPQKLLTGKIDLRHIVFHFFPVVQMLFRQLRQSNDRVQRGTHIMGHIGEEGILGFLALPGGLQGLLQKLYLAQLLFLLVIHHAEAEHRLLGIQGFVKKKTNVYPAVFAVENALEIPAVIPDSSGYETSDILQGKACPEVFKYIRLHQFSHGVHEKIIISLRRDFSPHIVGALDHVIGSPGKIHAIDGVK